jgi:hypothetical protein
MSNRIIIATIAKNAAEDVRIALDEFEGHEPIDLRVFAEFGGPARVKMTSNKGLSLLVELLPELVAALQQALATAHDLGFVRRAAL